MIVIKLTGAQESGKSEILGAIEEGMDRALSRYNGFSPAEAIAAGQEKYGEQVILIDDCTQQLLNELDKLLPHDVRVIAVMTVEHQPDKMLEALLSVFQSIPLGGSCQINYGSDTWRKIHNAITAVKAAQ